MDDLMIKDLLKFGMNKHRIVCERIYFNGMSQFRNNDNILTKNYLCSIEDGNGIERSIFMKIYFDESKVPTRVIFKQDSREISSLNTKELKQFSLERALKQI